jgi:hypothetical protein
MQDKISDAAFYTFVVVVGITLAIIIGEVTGVVNDGIEVVANIIHDVLY